MVRFSVSANQRWTSDVLCQQHEVTSGKYLTTHSLFSVSKTENIEEEALYLCGYSATEKIMLWKSPRYLYVMHKQIIQSICRGNMVLSAHIWKTAPGPFSIGLKKWFPYKEIKWEEERSDFSDYPAFLMGSKIVVQAARKTDLIMSP